MSCGGSPRDYGAAVLGHRPLGDGSGLIAVRCEEIASCAEPGQFVLVRPGTGNDPFLGRPLAVADAAGDVFKVVYRIVGRGTALLASKRQGDPVTVRGPVGRGFFSARGEKALPRKVILAGGSVGAAPLLFAARRLGMSRIEKTVMGVAGKGWEGFAEWLKEAFPGVDLYSDDGTAGKKGTVLSGLPGSLPPDTELWACGPQGMLRAVAEKYPLDGHRIMAALESRMACGMGGCMGCVIPTVSGNRRVCVDGPVFSADEVKWNELSPC
ncbi:MAG: dihydroorotate dehydrogenase [Aminivibrio sp.]|nr:dihydroorotate dehydrogenase [Aminivibrio sp.]